MSGVGPTIRCEDFLWLGQPRFDERSQPPPSLRASAWTTTRKSCVTPSGRNRKPLGAAADRLQLIGRDAAVPCESRCGGIAELFPLHFTKHGRIYWAISDTLALSALGGLLVCDAYGGPHAMQPRRDGATLWRFHLHLGAGFLRSTHRRSHKPDPFRFSRWVGPQKAFTYRWRLWSLPELARAFDGGRFCRTASGFRDRGWV